MALDCVSSQKDLDMILTADYHTHSPYSHGKNTIFENAEQAKKIGLKAIAISDHGFTHLAYGIKRREMDSFMAECREAEEKLGLGKRIEMLEGRLREITRLVKNSGTAEEILKLSEIGE